MKYYLGLDNGGTTTKASILDENGKEIGSSSVSTDAILPFPGFVERDMEDMWEANCRVIRNVLEKTGTAPEDILGIGICGHGKGLYLWGKDGKPARNGIISTDNRAYSYVNRWQENGTESLVFEHTCQHILACQPVALLNWIKDNEPDIFGNIQWVFECKDYVRFRLTGMAAAERTDYSGANLINLYSGEYDDELLSLFGLAELKEALPPLCDSLDVVGCITPEAAEKTGLLSGTPVIGGMFDIDACALGTGIIDGMQICMIAGTWSINEYIRNEPIVDGSVLMNSLYSIPGYYLIEESSPTSASNNEWFLQQILGDTVKSLKDAGKDCYDTMNSWVESIPPTEFVPVFLPFILASNVHPNAKACFIGLCANHTRKHMLRSVYEGIAFGHRMHIEKLLAGRSEYPTAVRMAGGASHSRVWAQIFADILQLPIETVDVNEAGNLGLAVGCSVALGNKTDLQSAVHDMVRVSATFMPSPELADVYNRKYELYKKAIASLDPIWNDIQHFIEDSHK